MKPFSIKIYFMYSKKKQYTKIKIKKQSKNSTVTNFIIYSVFDDRYKDWNSKKSCILWKVLYINQTYIENLWNYIQK